MMWSWGILGALVHITFWLLVILLVVKLIRGKKNWKDEWHKFAGDKGALDILKERYAKGEITKAEFEAIKKDIAN